MPADVFRPREWDVEVTDPAGELAFTLTLRETTGADELEIERVAERSEAEAGLLQVQRSLVRWTLPNELTPDTLQQLTRHYWRQIARAVLLGPPTPPTTKAETDADADAVRLAAAS